MKKATFILINFFIILLIIAPVSAQQATPQTTPQPQAIEQAQTKWWNDRVFYEVFVRSFYDGNGDGIGDLQGLIQKLDYLQDLGITGLWLMPIMASPSYHGYDSTDYKAVNPDYGTNNDFKQLMTAAHQHGMGVIVDLVINHTSDQHPWFKASAAGDPKYANWYIWQDKNPGYLGPWNEQVWYALAGRFYYAIFCGCQPDLNYNNPDVTAAMDDVAHYWLSDMGADGFRLDALQHIIETGQKQQDTPATRQWASDFHQYIQSVKPDSLTVGEVNNSDFVSSAYVPHGADLTFDFDLANTMVQSAKQGTSSNVISLQKRANGLTPDGQYAAFLTNHDQPRIITDLNGNVSEAKVAADLLMTQPGVPFVYYGEEIGMQGQKPDERIRTPMQWDSTATTGGFTTGQPWEALQNDMTSVNVAAETSDPTSLLSTYRTLIHLREAHPALEHGDWTQVNSTSHKVYSFMRQTSDETLLVVINMSSDRVNDYGLSLSKGLSSGAQASLLTGAGDLTQPQIDANGGFSGYLPLAELAPDSLTVIQLQ